MSRKNILRNADYASKILELTSDTLIQLDKEGICIDIKVNKTFQWFINEKMLLGKNVLKMLPNSTYHEFYPAFRATLTQKNRHEGNFQLIVRDETYYFKCILHPFLDGVLCQYRDITERSLRKEELIKKNHELNEIQKAARICNWEYDTFTQHFRQLCENDNVGMGDISAMSIVDFRRFIVPEDKEAFDRWMENNLKGNMENDVTFRMNKDNHIFYYKLKCYAREKHKNGQVTIEGYMQDITDIQRSRNDINLLTHAVNNSTEDIYAATEDGKLLLANREFRKRHHITPMVVAAHTHIYDLPTYGRDKEGWHEFVKSIKDGKRNGSYIVTNPIKGHPETLAVEANSYWVTSDEGMGTIWAFGRDISKRLKNEQQIKRFYQILDKTINSLPAGIVVKDSTRNFEYLYSKRYGLQTGIDESSIGKNDFDLFPAEEAAQKRQQDIRVIETGQPMHWTVERKMEDGTIKCIDKQKIKIESDDFPPLLLSIEWDITKLELMKRDLIEAKEKAETSDRLKSAFLANMSHEIRTPLNAIVGFSRVIAESEDADERREYFSIVESNNERLLKLINEILDLSKIEAGTVDFFIAPFRLHPLCREIYEALAMRCPEGVRLVFDPSDEDILMTSDKNRLFQVISNLIGNAYKFTTQGCVRYGYRKEGDNLVFYVADTGAGIDAEKLNTIFDRFVKANEFVQGTGLGLSICKTIIERLKGHIGVTSEKGKDTTFTFTLPQHQPTQDAEADYQSADAMGETDSAVSDATGSKPEAPMHQGADSTQKIILVAEDIDCNFTLIKAILGKEYQLERAKDGMEAVSLYDELHPDLILMDMNMPNLNGLDATKIIRQLSADAPIIALTAYAFEKDKKAALDAGCNDFMTKPFTQEELRKIINKYIYP